MPTPDQQVPVKTLARSLVASVLVAIVALIAFVLPAEYHIDPLGIGELLGIEGMSGYDVSALTIETSEPVQDTIVLPLEPFESVEYKFQLLQGQAIVYQWRSPEEVVFDLHSEEAGTDPEDAVTFSAGRAESQQGTYVAPFDGLHGWFWENRSSQYVEVTLVTTGYAQRATLYNASGAFERLLGDSGGTDQ